MIARSLLTALIFLVSLNHASYSQGAASDSSRDLKVEWKTPTGEYPQIRGTHAGTLFYTAEGKLGAIDIAKGTILWSAEFSGLCNGATVSDDRYFVMTNDESNTTTLAAYSLNSGERKHVATFQGVPTAITFDKIRLYVLLPDCTIAAISLSDYQRVWTKTFATTDLPTDFSNRLTISNDLLFVGMAMAGFYCLESESGTLLWSETDTHASSYVVVRDGGIVTTFDPVSMREPRSGKAIWEFASTGFKVHSVFGDVMIGGNDNSVTGIDLKSGMLLWKWAESWDEAYRFVPDEPLVTSSKGTIIIGEELRYVDPAGRVVWSARRTFDGQIRIVEDDFLIVQEASDIVRYRLND